MLTPATGENAFLRNYGPRIKGADIEIGVLNAKGVDKKAREARMRFIRSVRGTHHQNSRI
jgi:hypothetical protein